MKPGIVSIISLLLLILGCKSQDSNTETNNTTRRNSRGIATLGIAALGDPKSGELAPAFRLPDIQGVMHSLDDYRGKLILLNFWATWCAPCVAEMPALERLYGRFKDEGLVILAIDVDPKTSFPDVTNFVKKTGLSFPILLDAEIGLPPKYTVERFPETFFISPAGRILEVRDPESNKLVPRIVADRPWDSELYINFVASLLKQVKS